MITDDRFASAQSDPRFMEAPKRRSKVTIDSRFHRVFTDSSFTASNAPIDKQGKPNNNNKSKSKGATSLKHYYRQEEEDNKTYPIEEEEEEDDDDEGDSDAETGLQTDSDSSETLNNNILDDDDDEQRFDESSSTTDSDDQSMDEDVEEEDTFVQLPEDNVPKIDKETRRLAIVNLDWSQVRVRNIVVNYLPLQLLLEIILYVVGQLIVQHFTFNSVYPILSIFSILQAGDLYVLLCSFLPKGGQIMSVAVYPTDLGLKRMEEEDVHGPIGLCDADEENEHDDDGDNDEINDKKLRAYELNRLRYYYAVVECDSSATADYLYKNCDGVEIERSANKLDLRFIPDSMDFKRQPHDVATEAPADYEGLDFETPALQHSKVSSTWDEDAQQRVRTLNRKVDNNQLDELELKEFLASDGSETDDNDDDKREKYRALFQSGSGSDEENNNDLDMEVTFNSGLEDISKQILEKKDDNRSETVWEACLRKRKEKKKTASSKSVSKYSSADESSDTDQELEVQPDDFFVEEPMETESKDTALRNTKKGKRNSVTTNEAEASKAELELIIADDKGGADTNLKGYNLKPKRKNKGKKGKAIPDEEGKIPTCVEYDDSRFSAFITSPLYALDPTDPQFKRSAAYARQITQKQRGVGSSQENVVGQMDQSEIPAETSLASYGLPQKKKEKSELSSMVRSLKMKSKLVPFPCRGKERRKYKDLLYTTKIQR
ncbi:hypothetical protein BUALT_Bualt14G0021600 [Buddleja alternifolia]|uniref:NUC153 domain-containing protein n=1 Tax=Buddleja alternifolia TaxID=168488 RepID=A0AAV6WKU9_9LAMI|nr:hypothetical protein BUALT_Bualt14G0021600 [Buddleja alternifolia]